MLSRVTRACVSRGLTQCLLYCTSARLCCERAIQRIQKTKVRPETRVELGLQDRDGDAQVNIVMLGMPGSGKSSFFDTCRAAADGNRVG